MRPAAIVNVHVNVGHVTDALHLHGLRGTVADFVLLLAHLYAGIASRVHGTDPADAVLASGTARGRRRLEDLRPLYLDLIGFRMHVHDREKVINRRIGQRVIPVDNLGGALMRAGCRRRTGSRS